MTCLLTACDRAAPADNPGANDEFWPEIGKAVCDETVEYEVRRVMRRRQPWSAALLTEFAHYEARTAFEHYFGERVEAAPEGDP